MQKRLCGNNIDQDVAVMLSPSKLAAERIYSTKRNSISFHAALQSGSPELAIASFEKPVQDMVPMTEQKPTFPTLAQRSYPASFQEPSEEVMATLYQQKLPMPKKETEKIQQLLQDNDQQFKIVQQQIDLLRKVVAATGSPVPPQPIVFSIPTPQAVPVSQPAPAALPVSQPAAVAPVPENNSIFLLMQKLIFAAIFIVGLLRIVEWLVEKVTNVIVPDESNVETKRSSSRSSSFSFR